MLLLLIMQVQEILIHQFQTPWRYNDFKRSQFMYWDFQDLQVIALISTHLQIHLDEYLVAGS